MSTNSKHAICVVMLTAAALLPFGAVAAEVQSDRVAAAKAARQREDFTRRLDSAKELNEALKRVSQQKKVDKAEFVRATEQKIRAAEAAAAEGRDGEARILLEDAYLGTKLAIVDLAQASPGVRAEARAPETSAKDRKDYAARVDSTKALRDALARIADEKRDDSARAELSVIDRLMQQAETLVAQDVKRGRAVLDHAYLRAKVQIERLRGGATLVRTLQFETPADEYRYEVDRNDSYRMLVPLLAGEGGRDDAAMDAHVHRAGDLRKEADTLAGREEFEAAIKALEESSGEYQKAIRSAGVLLPG